MAAVAANPTAGTAEKTVFRITASAIDANDSNSFDGTKYPTEPAITYVFEATASGQPTLLSPVLTPSADGDCEWNGVIFPGTGTWTVALELTADDSTAASTTIVVS